MKYSVLIKREEVENFIREMASRKTLNESVQKRAESLKNVPADKLLECVITNYKTQRVLEYCLREMQKPISLQEKMDLFRLAQEGMKGHILFEKKTGGDIAPYNSTGINVLEELLGSIISDFELKYKTLATSKQQRDSFRAHIVNGLENMLANPRMNLQAEKPSEVGTGEEGMLPDEPAPVEGELPPVEGELPPEEQQMVAESIKKFVRQLLEQEAVDPAVPEEEQDIPAPEDASPESWETNPKDQDKLLDLNDTPEVVGNPFDGRSDKEREELARFGIPGQDETGKRFAFDTLKGDEKIILRKFNLLDDAKDQKLFIDYLIANVKLYFDRYEEEMSNTLEEPTNAEYDAAKAEQPTDATAAPAAAAPPPPASAAPAPPPPASAAPAAAAPPAPAPAQMVAESVLPKKKK